ALLPPLVLVSVLAMLLARGSSIYENQVKDRFSSPAHLADLTVNVLEEMKVGDVYRPSESLVSVAPSTRFAELRATVLAARQGTGRGVEAGGRLRGLVTAEQLRPVLDEPQLDGLVVASDLAGPPLALLRDDDLYRAHELFRSSAYPQLPVVEAPDPEDPQRGRILGLLDYRDMMHAYHVELQRRRES